MQLGLKEAIVDELVFILSKGQGNIGNIENYQEMKWYKDCSHWEKLKKAHFFSEERGFGLTESHLTQRYVFSLSLSLSFSLSHSLPCDYFFDKCSVLKSLFVFWNLSFSFFALTCTLFSGSLLANRLFGCIFGLTVDCLLSLESRWGWGPWHWTEVVVALKSNT